MTTDRIDLDFDTGSGKTACWRLPWPPVIAWRNRSLFSKPGVDPADTRILRSDVIKTKMRPDGQDIDNVETPRPDLSNSFPNRPAQPHRWMNGDQLLDQVRSEESDRVLTLGERSHPHRKPKAQGRQRGASPGSYLEQRSDGATSIRKRPALEAGTVERISLRGRHPQSQSRPRVARTDQEPDPPHRHGACLGSHRFHRTAT